MADLVKTLQSNLRNTDHLTITNKAYFLGGTDTTHAALSQYDLLRTGYGRIFILRMPAFAEKLLPDATAKFKHLLEYANVGIDGIQGYSVDFESLTAGYVGNSVEIPVNVKDDTNSITIKLYETSGSIVRTYLDFWITGVGDPYIGLSHYHGARTFDSSLVASQANQTMEALYVATDQTGEELEYACLLTNMFPKESDHSHFVSEPGSHGLVSMSINFTATKYVSSQINALGKAAIKKYAILRNYLNFAYSDYDPSNTDTSLPGKTAVEKGIWSEDQTSSLYNGAY